MFCTGIVLVYDKVVNDELMGDEGIRSEQRRSLILTRLDQTSVTTLLFGMSFHSFTSARINDVGNSHMLFYLLSYMVTAYL